MRARVRGGAARAPLFAAVIVVASTTAACGGARPEARDVAAPSPDATCREPSALASPYVTRGLARGDVDGDGADDAVAVLANYDQRAGCRFFLAADLADGGFVVRRLPEAVVGATSATARDVPWPRLTLLAQIDRRTGVEAALTVEQGAGTGSLAVFGFRGDRFVRFAVDVASMRNQFSWSSGTYPSTVDCASANGGDVVHSSARRTGRGWRVTRRFFRVDGQRFVHRTRAIGRLLVTDLARLPEFRPSPALEGRYPFQACDATLAAGR